MKKFNIIKWLFGKEEKPLDLRNGASELSRCFGLSRASFLTLPRVMMQDMPDDWQLRMSDLLDEIDAEYINAPDIDFRVSAIDPKTKRIKKMLPALSNYRYPDRSALNSWSGRK